MMEVAKYLRNISLSVAVGVSITTAITYLIYPYLSEALARVALCLIGLLLAGFITNWGMLDALQERIERR